MAHVRRRVALLSKSRDPNDRIGVFKQLADVPHEYRFEQLVVEYEGRDLWDEFLATELFPANNSYQTKQTSRPVGWRWENHIAHRGRHHALARPSNVKTYDDLFLQRKARYPWLLDTRAWDALNTHDLRVQAGDPALAHEAIMGRREDQRKQEQTTKWHVHAYQQLVRG